MRRLWALVHWLPVDSAYVLAADPDGLGSGWDLQTSLLASLIEVADLNNVLLMHIYSKEGTKVRDPITIARPGRRVSTETGKPEMAKTEELKSFMWQGGAEGAPGNVVVH